MKPQETRGGKRHVNAHTQVSFDMFKLTKREGISEIKRLSTHLLCQKGLITHRLRLWQI